MRPPALVAVVLVALSSCSPSAESPDPPPAQEEPGAVQFTGGGRYDKSSYVDDVGRTVLSFRLRVKNLGNDTGRAQDPQCHVTIDDERYVLQIYENPELAPGEHGWFRTGGPVPRLDHREFDDVEPYCDF